MTTVRLTDDQWTKLRAVLQRDPHAYIGRDDAASRRFVEAVLWIDRSGAQWRFLPAEYGAWNTVYKRFARWCDQGMWARMLRTWNMASWIAQSSAPIRVQWGRKKTAARLSKRWGAVAVASARRSTSSSMGWGIRCACD